MMEKDPLIDSILKFCRIKRTVKNHDILFTILYNFVPAFIFAPYLIYVGIRYDLTLLLLMGAALFLVDFMHFIKATRKIV
jgi:hypothetical protein